MVCQSALRALYGNRSASPVSSYTPTKIALMSRLQQLYRATVICLVSEALHAQLQFDRRRGRTYPLQEPSKDCLVPYCRLRLGRLHLHSRCMRATRGQDGQGDS